MTFRRLAGRAALALILLSSASFGFAAELPPAPPAGAPFLTRSDAWYGVMAAAGVMIAGLADQTIARNMTARGGEGGRRLCDVVRPLGTLGTWGPGLLLGAAAGRAFDRPGLTRSTLRVAASVAVAAAATGVVKMSVGRERPMEAPDDVSDFHPFSGHDSFPSGHATIAFAAATAIDRETSARWVPWTVYPIAGLVGWSRVHDARHWSSDVVAGAALGYWTASKVESFRRVPGAETPRVGALVAPRPAGFAVAASLSF